jgi:hypothetical protein
VSDEWLDEEVALAVLGSEGPWPTRPVRSDGTYVPLDVDRYDRFAMVLCFGDNNFVTHKVVGFGVFEDTGAGGGAGSLEAQVGGTAWTYSTARGFAAATNTICIFSSMTLGTPRPGRSRPSGSVVPTWPRSRFVASGILGSLT